MYFVDSLLSAASLAMDACAVSLCIGASVPGAGRGTAVRMGAACGIFQFFMPLAGWLVGAYAAGPIASFDHWVAFGLLALVGGNMIRGSRSEEETCYPQDPTLSLTLFYLAVATSIDALAVGASFALTARPIAPLAVSAGLITYALCHIGVRFGERIGCKRGKRVELAGGIVLILIGLNILREHML